MDPKSNHLIEQKALGRGKWANLFMGIAGICAALTSNATALMLDGLFSAVNFLAAIFAARVAMRVSRAPDAMRPFGYEIDEAVYVMFRALVLIGVVLAAAFAAVEKILRFANGGEIAPVKLNWVIIYVIAMALTSLGLAFWYHRNWLTTDRQSNLLKAEKSGAIIDGVLSLAAGAAFVLIAALEDTSLAFLVPISDSIVILALAIYIIPKPISLFRSAMEQVLGEADETTVKEKIESAIRDALADGSFKLLHVDLVKVGRSRFGAVYLSPRKPVTGSEIDQVRSESAEACRTTMEHLGPIRIECLFRGDGPDSETWVSG